MNVTKELGPILEAENKYINDIVDSLKQIGESVTEKSVHDLRMGFRTKALIDLKMARARAGGRKGF